MLGLLKAMLWLNLISRNAPVIFIFVWSILVFETCGKEQIYAAPHKSMEIVAF
jgi:hypothetical protein